MTSTSKSLSITPRLKNTKCAKLIYMVTACTKNLETSKVWLYSKKIKYISYQIKPFCIRYHVIRYTTTCFTNLKMKEKCLKVGFKCFKYSIHIDFNGINFFVFWNGLEIETCFVIRH